MAPRLRQIPRAEAAPSVLPLYDLLFGPERDPVADPGTATGTPGNWWTCFANDPAVFDHCVAGFALYRGTEAYLDPRLRELGQTRAGWARGSAFVFSQHCKAMRSLGFSEEQIEAVPAWSTATCFDEAQRAVLAFADALVLDGGRVPDALFEQLRAVLDDRQVLALAYVIALYDLHATLTKAFRLELDDRDEPAVEHGERMGLDIGRATSGR